MIEQLFGSKTRVKLLRLFYSNDKRSFYVREITRKIDEQINSVRRELANLLNIGIITTENVDNKVYYQVNKKYQFYKPLSAIFAPIEDTSVLGQEVSSEHNTDEFKLLGKVDLILLTGQLTLEPLIKTDVLIVGSINKNAAMKYIADLENEESKSLSYTIMSKVDFKYRIQIKDKFITQILRSRYQIVIDKENLISEVN